jgi:hypothetical protein
MFCAPPVEAAVAGGNARCGRGTIVPRSLLAARTAWRSRRARDRRRTCGVIAARPQSTNGIAEPRRAAVLALPRPPALRFFNRANKWRRRNALAHVNR